MPKSALLSLPDPATFILTIRSQRVILDTDLATLYGVETGQFNRAVQRHFDRFPDDFMFQLMKDERKALRCQIGISKAGLGGRRYTVVTALENYGPPMNRKRKVGKLLPPIPLDFEIVGLALGKTAPPPKEQKP